MDRNKALEALHIPPGKTNSALKVLRALIGRLDGDSFCGRVKTVWLEEDTGLSDAAIKKARQHLEAQGYLTVDTEFDGRGRAIGIVYEIVVDPEQHPAVAAENMEKKRLRQVEKAEQNARSIERYKRIIERAEARQKAKMAAEAENAENGKGR
jgi:hypothetical protein